MLVASHNGFFSGRKEQGAQHNWKDQSIECANHNKDRDRATNKREDEGRKNDKSNDEITMVFFKDRAEGPNKGHRRIVSAYNGRNGR